MTEDKTTFSINSIYEYYKTRPHNSINHVPFPYPDQRERRIIDHDNQEITGKITVAGDENKTRKPIITAWPATKDEWNHVAAQQVTWLRHVQASSFI